MPSEFSCPACGASFPNAAALREHGSSAHRGGEPASAQPAFECKACGGRFPSEAELKVHAAQSHQM